MAALNWFNCAMKDVLSGKHNFKDIAYKLMLSNVAPVLTNTLSTDITEISAGNGYSAGGPILTLNTVETFNTSSGRVIFADQSITASGGTIATFRYGVIYNSVNLSLVGYIDIGGTVSLPNGQFFMFDMDQVNGLMQLSLG